MRIIKKLLMAFCLFMFCASGTEAAMSSTLPQNEFSLGGIRPEITVNEVLDIYGSPTSIDNKGDLVYDYGGTVKIFFGRIAIKIPMNMKCSQLQQRLIMDLLLQRD